MKRKLLVVLIMAFLTVNLSACVNEKATITTTVYAVKYLVEQIAGDKVNVEYISTEEYIQNAKLVKNYEEILSRTTLFLYINELEPYLDVYHDLLYSYDFEVIDLANLSAIYDFKRYTRVLNDNVFVYRETDYYEDESFQYVDLYTKDPFIWLDPIAMSAMASTIKQWLIAYYPEDTLVFENNFKNLQNILIRMDAEYQSLKEIEDVKIVTVTPCFGNWQKLYGVTVYPLVISKYGVLPTEEQLDFIIHEIKECGVKYIVYDDTLPEMYQELYESIREELKLEVIELSSLSILSSDDIEKNKDYITIMYENLTALENAFK
ncbi:MAG TPA: zinc ABC transporter substrate-binding protein [Erysipelotrichaceae bacterium]|nr:zinc ABC transporter substrate-binding protein [Erysipelotrichaceae bacterium]